MYVFADPEKSRPNDRPCEGDIKRRFPLFQGKIPDLWILNEYGVRPVDLQKAMQEPCTTAYVACEQQWDFEFERTKW